ncbi:hypothetical protein [Sphingobacterium tabacisoli]|uniref:Tetratricopeptide repeat protein n=1 Tax=Sphingobacterium tabacisoli TaxID=2044855 RepID=A0ABW5L1D4_9SPHI|nr:hypothetical protein [Sphingobacterium tabacisoli]
MKKTPVLVAKPMLLLVLIVLCLVNSPLYGQSKFISYKSKAEQNQFEDLDSHEDKLRVLLLASLDESTVESKISNLNSFIDGLNWTAQDMQKPNKRLKQIFKQVHNSYLRKYDEKASSSQMFIDGTYQCVSASILYTYIFEKLGIPYEIKEQPTHVYLIAFPKRENILIETTDPSLGVFVPDTKAQTKYVQALVTSKYLDQEYVNKVGIEKAFNEFLYGKTNISFVELVGLAFYNLGIYASEDQDYETAYSNFYKTNRLYPAKKHDFLQYETLALLIDKNKIEKPEDWDPIIILVNKTNRENAKLVLKSRFAVQMNNDLMLSQNRENIQEIYKQIQSSLQDSILMSELKDLYLLESGRSYIMSREHKKALPFIEEMLAIKPESPLAQKLLLDCVNDDAMLDAPTSGSVSKLNGWIEKYPDIKKDVNVQYYLAYYYLSSTITNFKNERFEEAVNLYKHFVGELQNSPNVRERLKNDAKNTFGCMIVYNMAVKKDKKAARKAYDEALSIYPDINEDVDFKKFQTSLK